MATLTSQKKITDPEATGRPNFILQLLNRYLRSLIVAIVVIIMFMSYSLVLAEKFNQVRNIARESLPAKEKVLSDLEVLKDKVDGILLDYNMLKVEKAQIFSDLDVILPRQSQYETFFVMAEEISRQNGMKLTSINIALGEGGGGSIFGGRFQPVGSVDEGELVDTAAIRSITLSLNVQGGGYEEFKKYLDALERNMRLFDVQSFTLSGSSSASQSGANSGQVSEETTTQYNIQLITYYQSIDL
jgi:hypothetical protein